VPSRVLEDVDFDSPSQSRGRKDSGVAGAQPLQQQPASGATPRISPGLGRSPARLPARRANGRLPLLANLLVLGGFQAGLAAGDAVDVQIHGFIGQGYVLTSDNGYYHPATGDGGSLDFREIGLNVICRPEERLRLGIQIMSQDMGRVYNNALSIDWANAVYTLPLQGWEADLKVGRIRTGHGLYNDFRDLDLSRISVFLPESVYYNSWRRLYLALDGIGAEIRSPDTRFGSFRIGAVFGTQQVPADDPMLEVYEETVDASELKRQWGVQLSWLPSEGLTLKLSMLGLDEWNTTFAPADPDAEGSLLADDSPRYDELIASLEYNQGGLSIASEFVWWSNQGRSSYRGAAPEEVESDDWKQSGYGGYLSAGWEFTPAWRAQVLLQAHNLRYAGSYPEDYAFTDQTRAVGAAASWSITPHWLLKAEVQRIKGMYFLRAADQPTPGAYESDDWTLFVVKTSFDF